MCCSRAQLSPNKSYFPLFRYIEALTYRFLASKDRNSCIFQAPLLYNWNLDAVSVVTRVTGITRAFLMMGALIPLNINSMSIFSFSGALCIAGEGDFYFKRLFVERMLINFV